ncbi:MAG: flagellar filament capping protein FliD [Helicobacter sp.]|nr:flagellar filament capping protein FliD [Helicobacter sp.]
MATTQVMGLGSGFLDNTLFDNLKKVQEETIIEPLTKKMQTNLDKQTSLTEIMTLIEQLKTNVKKFTDGDTYNQRKATTTGEGITATISPGIPVQDITVEVHQLAKNDLTQLGRKYESRDSTFSATNSSLKFNHNGKDYQIDILAGETLADVAQKITDTTDGAVMGIIMKTGGNQPYQLMIQSKDTGEANRVYFGNTLSSGLVKGGALTADVEFTIKDANGNDKTISFGMNTSATNTSQENAVGIVETIKYTMNQDPDLKKLLDDGTISVELVNDGKGFIINDQRGYDISVASGGSGGPLSELGLTAGTTSAGTDDFTGSTTVKGGAVSGWIAVGNVRLDLSLITSASNTAEQNLTALVDAINNAGGNVQAKAVDGKLVLNDTAGYGNVQIILDADNTAQENADIASKLGITGGFHMSTANFLKEAGITNVQRAQDAKFSWNGIEISRSTNTVDDVVSGISVELTKEHTGTDHSVIRITRDDDDIFKGIDEFVKTYNELISKIEEETRYDEKTKIAGNLNGESAITGIRSTLKNILNFTAGTGLSVSISSYGFSFDDEGRLKIDEKTLKDKFKEDPELAIAFFKGGEFTVGGFEIAKRDVNGEVIEGEFERIGGTKTTIDGLFTQFSDAIEKMITGSNSTLKSFEQSLKDDYDRVKTDKENQQSRLDERMEATRARMNAYDAMISKMTQAQQTLQQMINASSGNS